MPEMASVPYLPTSAGTLVTYQKHPIPNPSTRPMIKILSNNLLSFRANVCIQVGEKLGIDISFYSFVFCFF